MKDWTPLEAPTTTSVLAWGGGGGGGGEGEEDSEMHYNCPSDL